MNDHVLSLQVQHSKVGRGLTNPTSEVAEQGRRAAAGGLEEEGSALPYTMPRDSWSRK
jgi:hypothetical protein